MGVDRLRAGLVDVATLIVRYIRCPCGTPYDKLMADLDEWRMVVLRDAVLPVPMCPDCLDHLPSNVISVLPEHLQEHA